MNSKYFVELLFVAIMLSAFQSCESANNKGESGKEGSISTTPSFEDNFDSSINNEVWQVAGWVEHGGKTSPDRCYTADGKLNMIFRYDPSLVSVTNTGFLSAAIQTRKSFLYGRWEARLKPSPVTGVLNSFYTIDWGDGSGTKQEIDIEFLTFAFRSGSGKVHYAIHADGRTSTDTNPDIVLNFNPSDDFHVYGFEITPEHVEWFVDDKVLYTYKYSGNSITINAPYQLKLNVWSQNGAGTWIKGPPSANTDCIYQIDWIRFYPYVSD